MLRELPPIEELFPQIHFKASTFYDANGDTIAEFEYKDAETASIEEINDFVKYAFVAVEDESFFSNRRTGISRLVFDIKKAITTGEAPAYGISGLLARRVFLNNYNSVDQRHDLMRNSLMPLLLEDRYVKDDLFISYINLLYFGHGAYGVKRAARVFFEKNLKDLTLEEAALLAAAPNLPTYYSPFNKAENAKKRRDVILKKMRELNFITEVEYASAIATPINVVKSSEQAFIKDKAPYFMTYLMDVIQEELQIPANRLLSQGYHVYTTLDLKMNRYAEEALEYGMEIAKERNSNVSQGALVSMDPQTGRILAMVGGPDLEEPSDISAFSPVLVLAADESEVTLLDMVASYSGFANMGKRVTPVAIDKIVDSDGNVIYKRKYRQGAKVIDDNVISRIIPPVMDAETTADIGRPVAGTTGTTNNLSDMWYVGFVPQQATAVWFGSVDKAGDESLSRTDVMNVDASKAAWARFMNNALEGKPVQEFKLTQ